MMPHLLSRWSGDYLRPSARTTRDIRVIPFRILTVIPVRRLLYFTVNCGLFICVRLLWPIVNRWLVIWVRLLWPGIKRRLVICVRIVIYYVRIVLIRIGGVSVGVAVCINIGVTVRIVAIGIGIVREPGEPEESTEEEV